MKKLLILLLILLFAGAFIGQLMIQDSGYTLIAYNNVTIEMSLWVFLIVLLGVFFYFTGHSTCCAAHYAPDSGFACGVKAATSVSLTPKP
ncbi:hypothetical protein [Aliamphritea spongicola]|nr:hypothetical protein [Aliamphritea spongicola]